jgi:hypothetical protein
MARSVESARDALRAIEYRDEPALLVVAEDEDGLDRLSDRSRLAGCRVGGRSRIEAGAERLEAQIAVDAVLVELGEGGPEAAAGLLDRLVSDSRALRSVVAVPASGLDALSAVLLHPRVHALCEPAADDWRQAIAAAVAPPPAMLNDITKGHGTARLQQLSEEVGRVASILAALSEDEAVATAAGAAEVQEEDGRRIDSGFVRAIIRARRLRDQFFRGEWFADPAWDMLLDLMAARLDRQRVAVSSLCIAAAVPPTTALRWIKALCEQGLFVRVADPEDGRRVFIELSDDAATRLEAYLKAAHRVSPLIL